MTLNELIEITDSDTVVQIVINMCDTQFKARRYADEWQKRENEDMRKREVEKVGTNNNALVIYLK